MINLANVSLILIKYYTLEDQKFYFQITLVMKHSLFYDTLAVAKIYNLQTETIKVFQDIDDLFIVVKIPEQPFTAQAEQVATRKLLQQIAGSDEMLEALIKKAYII